VSAASNPEPHIFYNCVSLSLFLRKITAPTNCSRANPTPARSADNLRAKISRFREQGRSIPCCKRGTQREKFPAQIRKTQCRAAHRSQRARLANGHRLESVH